VADDKAVPGCFDDFQRDHLRIVDAEDRSICVKRRVRSRKLPPVIQISGATTSGLNGLSGRLTPEGVQCRSSSDCISRRSRSSRFRRTPFLLSLAAVVGQRSMP
jgi:hypothetical protein